MTLLEAIEACAWSDEGADLFTDLAAASLTSESGLVIVAAAAWLLADEAATAGDAARITAEFAEVVAGMQARLAPVRQARAALRVVGGTDA